MRVSGIDQNPYAYARPTRSRSGDDTEGIHGVGGRDPGTSQTATSGDASPAVALNLSAPVQRLLDRAVAMYDEGTPVRLEALERGRQILTNWPGLTDDQIDAMLQSFGADVA